MNAIGYLTDYIKWLLIINPVLAGTLVTYLAFKKSMSDDDGIRADCGRKIKHAVIASAIVETISGFITIVKSYYV